MIAANITAGRPKHFTGIPVVQTKCPLPQYAPEWKDNRSHCELAVDEDVCPARYQAIVDAEVVARETAAFFASSDAFVGSRPNMLFKLGVQGLGYYSVE